MASGSKKVIYAALIGNGLIAITKFIASAITGSSAMMSEGIHSLVDTGNQVLLLFGLHQSKSPLINIFHLVMEKRFISGALLFLSSFSLLDQGFQFTKVSITFFILLK